MNNKGQTLVFFVALLPLVFILFAFIFDTALISIENNRIKDEASSAIKYLVSDNKNIIDVRGVIISNDKDINIVSITSNSVHLKKSIDPLFGKVVGYDKYNIEVDMSGYIDSNNKLIIKEKGN